MERFLFSCVAVAWMLLGVCMVIWPAWIVSLNRDKEDTRQTTSGEILQMRLLGILFAVLAGYGLYALVTKMAGAELNV
jgi:nucleoside permease NupC